jgi:hypothetical protein
VKVYECENCHSLFILNEADERVISGDYALLTKNPYCSLCNCGMLPIGANQNKDKDKETA